MLERGWLYFGLDMMYIDETGRAWEVGGCRSELRITGANYASITFELRIFRAKTRRAGCSEGIVISYSRGQASIR